MTQPAYPPSPTFAAWEEVDEHDFGCTLRLPVPGGWIYALTDWDRWEEDDTPGASGRPIGVRRVAVFVPYAVETPT